ncbi:MAG: hypothetical protein CME06_08570 [Gemmatimonadetes bacterium]|nr:hypothetical protein [Gemmatimonadota bacterium]
MRGGCFALARTLLSILALSIFAPAASADPGVPATAVDPIDRAARRRVGAWVISAAAGTATGLFLGSALDHWRRARTLDARSHDPSRAFGERRSLHEQALAEWDEGNRARTMAAATGLATLTTAALLLRLYGDETRPARSELLLKPSLDGGGDVRFSLRF